MARAARGRTRQFSPQWLATRLAQLLPGFPDVAACVAFSGGADSTALLAALAQLRRPPLRLRALHVDHRLHPDSAKWSAHCRRVARSLGVPLAVRSVTVARTRGESLEATARAARYQALAAALAPAEALLTAHHEDDQLETVLLQLLRGAGVAGLAAMPAITPFARGVLARPLLSMPRAQLGAWLHTQGLAWVEDDSNTELRRDRNYLRARVLPVIRERWPAAAATAARSARHLAEAQQLLDALGAADAGRAGAGTQLSAKVLRTLPPERRRNALRFWITSAGHLAPPTSLLGEIAGPLLGARLDAQPFVAWEGLVVQRQGDLLSLRAAAGAARGGRTAAHTAAAGPGAMPRLADIVWHWREHPSCALPPPFGTLTVTRDARGPLDLDALGPELILRERRGGERLRPVRGGPRRALKSLLQEAHVPVVQRAQLPLLFAGERLVAVADLWLDESVQAAGASPHRARLGWSGTR